MEAGPWLCHCCRCLRAGAGPGLEAALPALALRLLKELFCYQHSLPVPWV